MSTNSILSKIRQEIKRLKSTNPSEYNYQNAEGYTWALDDLLSFLDTLEEEPDKSLYEAATKFADTQNKNFLNPEIVKNIFIAGAKWQADHAPLPEDTVIFQKGVEEGRRLEREDIMKDAVECSVYAGKEGGKWIVSYIGNYESMMKICKGGDKVRIIVCKKED